jgi:inositol transport system substrate-binding protein
MGLHRIKRLSGVMLVSVLIVACSSTGTASQAPASAAAGGGAKVKVGVTFPILDQFLQTVADGMQAKATEMGTVELNIVAAQEKTDVQLGQVENFISQKVDAIIVIPVDTDAAGR